MTRRVIVCGSRNWDDPIFVYRILADMAPDIETVVHGACPRGADEMASRAVLALGLEEEKHPADWDLFGKSAGFIRNHTMALAGADLCIAFWDGQSNGTLHMIQQALKAGIPVHIHSMEEAMQ